MFLVFFFRVFGNFCQICRAFLLNAVIIQGSESRSFPPLRVHLYRAFQHHSTLSKFYYPRYNEKAKLDLTTFFLNICYFYQKQEKLSFTILVDFFFQVYIFIKLLFSVCNVKLILVYMILKN